MAIGTVKWFNPQKGFGFISPRDGGKDLFVHFAAVQQAGIRMLTEGQTVQYEVSVIGSKAQAVCLRVISMMP